jgi:hypothetical protein
MSKYKAPVPNDASAPQKAAGVKFSWPEISKEGNLAVHASIPAFVQHNQRACAEQTTRPSITSRSILWRNSLWRSLLLCRFSPHSVRPRPQNQAMGSSRSRPRFMSSLHRKKVCANALTGQGARPASPSLATAPCVMAATHAVITNLCALFQWQSFPGCDNLAPQLAHHAHAVAPPITFCPAEVTAPSENRSLSQCPNLQSCSPLAQPLHWPLALVRHQSLHLSLLRSWSSRPAAKDSDRAPAHRFICDSDLKQAAFSIWGQPC